MASLESTETRLANRNECPGTNNTALHPSLDVRTLMLLSNVVQHAKETQNQNHFSQISTIKVVRQVGKGALVGRCLICNKFIIDHGDGTCLLPSGMLDEYHACRGECTSPIAIHTSCAKRVLLENELSELRQTCSSCASVFRVGLVQHSILGKQQQANPSVQAVSILAILWFGLKWMIRFLCVCFFWGALVPIICGYVWKFILLSTNIDMHNISYKTGVPFELLKLHVFVDEYTGAKSVGLRIDAVHLGVGMRYTTFLLLLYYVIPLVMRLFKYFIRKRCLASNTDIKMFVN